MNKPDLLRGGGVQQIATLYLNLLSGLARIGLVVAPPLLRLALAVPFLLSGLTRWDGPFSLSPSTLFLFENVFRLHIMSGTYAFPAPDLVAFATAVAEIAFPILLIMGLGTRLAALALLVMTGVIELVAPDGGLNFHLAWAALAMGVIAVGPGAVSLDAWIGWQWRKRFGRHVP